jgi:hypothetical protein
MTVANTGRRLLKLAGALVAALVFVTVAYVGFLYFSFLDKTVTSGSAYGFTIGQSKAEAYRIAQTQFQNGEISRIHTIGSREEELVRYPEVNRSDSYYSVTEVRDWFDNWNHWSLWSAPNFKTPLVIITFKGKHVQGVGAPGNLGASWTPPNTKDITITAGQTYHEVYRSLETLLQAPGYESLQLDTGWMARRQPDQLEDYEFRFVANDDRWTLLIGSSESFFNNVELGFSQNRLTSIRRHRQYYELP